MWYSWGYLRGFEFSELDLTWPSSDPNLNLTWESPDLDLDLSLTIPVSCAQWVSSPTQSYRHWLRCPGGLTITTQYWPLIGQCCDDNNKTPSITITKHWWKVIKLWIVPGHCYLNSDPISISWENLLNGLTSAKITVQMIHFESIYQNIIQNELWRTILFVSFSLITLQKSSHVTILLRLCLERRDFENSLYFVWILKLSGKYCVMLMATEEAAKN